MSDVLLRYPGGELPLPEVPSTVGESGLNIGPLLKETGRITLDHGFLNTAACSSARALHATSGQSSGLSATRRCASFTSTVSPKYGTFSSWHNFLPGGILAL